MSIKSVSVKTARFNIRKAQRMWLIQLTGKIFLVPQLPGWRDEQKSARSGNHVVDAQSLSLEMDFILWGVGDPTEVKRDHGLGRWAGRNFAKILVSNEQG